MFSKPLYMALACMRAGTRSMLNTFFRESCHNYVKGRAIKRVGLLLGNGLMVSEGEFWKSQRRMIQPAFHDNVIGAMTNNFQRANFACLKNGRCTRKRESMSRATSA